MTKGQEPALGRVEGAKLAVPAVNYLASHTADNILHLRGALRLAIPSVSGGALLLAFLLCTSLTLRE